MEDPCVGHTGGPFVVKGASELSWYVVLWSALFYCACVLWLRRKKPKLMSSTNDDVQKQFKEGKIIAGRWRIVKKLGEGGMGAVFKVEDKKQKNYFAAMKIEFDLTEGGLLKLEVFVLQQMKNTKHTVKLLDSGERSKYWLVQPFLESYKQYDQAKYTVTPSLATGIISYLCRSNGKAFMVMTMCGRDLMELKRAARGKFTESTTLRVGIGSLYAIKQLHEIGYVHRDIKPGNCMIGTVGRDARCIYLIDYGMVRAYALKDEKTGKFMIRKPREGEQLFRGTPRYCSINTHLRMEQGRVDDLWSWLWMLVELHCGLPWNRIPEEETIMKKKQAISIDELYVKCPKEFKNIHNYLMTLKYEDRPDYHGIYSECHNGMRRVGGSFMDRFCWEKEAMPEIQTALSISEKTVKDGKPQNRAVVARKAYPFASVVPFKENVIGL